MAHYEHFMSNNFFGSAAESHLNDQILKTVVRKLPLENIIGAIYAKHFEFILKFYRLHIISYHVQLFPVVYTESWSLV